MLNLRLNLGGNILLGGIPFSSDLGYVFDTRTSTTLVDKVAANNATIKGGYLGVVLTTATLTFTDLTGVTISDYIGTNTPVISVNDINFSAGQYQYLLLSDGTEMFFNGHLYDSFTGGLISGTGFSFILTTGDAVKGVIEGLERGYVELTSGEQVVNKTLNTTFVTVYDKLYYGQKTHNLINSFITFPYHVMYDRTNGVYNYTQRVLTDSGTLEGQLDLLSNLNEIGIYNQLSKENIYYDRAYSDRVFVDGGIVEDEENLLNLLLELDYSSISSTPTRFYISELNISTIDGYINIEAKEKFFQQIEPNYNNRTYIKALFVYNTQKTLLDAVKVHKYIGNGDNLIVDEFGDYVFDANNLPIWI